LSDVRDSDANTERQSGPEPDALWESERIVSDTIGRLMELWGFKRNMGRVWTLLYLSEAGLTAQQLRERLGLSSGAVSMTLSELGRWGVVRKTWVPGDRRDHFEAEANVWKMISRVLRERERAEVVQAIEAFEDALATLERRGDAAGPRGRIQRERIERLLDLAKLARTMVDTLIANARMDASWLPRFRLGRFGRARDDER
jgi:DNA-binding transcriptional regulator GbsR (MarR family)